MLRTIRECLPATVVELSLCLIALDYHSTAKAADWPQWRGPNRDGRSSETGLLKEWPEAGPKPQAAGADPGCWIGLLVKEGGHLFGFYHTVGAGLRGSPDHADIVGTRMSRREYPKDHPWLRIVRRGNVFTSYSSPDGANWTKAMKSTKPMRKELLAGVIARTMPYKSRALFRARVRNITLRADATPADPPRPAER